VRIPLDYYRILGLPIQATAEQLLQAHHDRIQQLPRREYSEVAIEARKQLIDEAYVVLSDPDQRQAYDATFLAKTYDLEQEIEKQPIEARLSDAPDSHTPSIEIDDKQFLGALLILQELGEYELVLKLSQPYLSSNRFGLKIGRFGEPQLVGPDIILTVTLACLELGREQWQQGQYENAAASLETGQELLLKEGLFPGVRGEIQADLDRLRPYRILELLDKPEDKLSERRKGLQLLQGMLQERRGIDGTGDDHSGLSVDDFLRFIQQLRAYLTADEQQTLFEAEARRPSAVATYLAVYALIAGGFAQRQPTSIRKGKQMLLRLGKRQDVYLEQAICALLLGQTEDASRALELSQEYETLDYIREQSKDAPDLLPGLCLYAERWLQEEVFPHFRDLANKQASLKDYFADQQVQAYLEALPAEEEEAKNEWFPVQSKLMATPKKIEAGSSSTWEPVVSVASRTATATLSSSPSGVSSLPGEPLPHSVPPPPLREAKRLSPAPARGEGSRTNGSTSYQTRSRSTIPGEERKTTPVGSSVRVSPAEAPERTPRRPSRNVGGSNSGKSGRWLGLALLALLILGIGFLGIKAVGWVAGQLSSLGGPKLEEEQPLLYLDRPPIPIPDPNQNPLAIPGPINEAIATQVIQKWLSTKAAALGPNHAVDQLAGILVDPALARWQQWGAEAKQANTAYEYEHSVEVRSVEMDKDDPDQAKVEARVSEQERLSDGGRQVSSSDNNYVIRYDLVRQQGEWRIKDWKVGQ
jgi:hypothetical protein